MTFIFHSFHIFELLVVPFDEGLPVLNFNRSSFFLLFIFISNLLLTNVNMFIKIYMYTQVKIIFNVLIVNKA